MESDRELDDAEVGGQMAAGFSDRLDDQVPAVLRQLL
jgi:hypothetical protein